MNAALPWHHSVCDWMWSRPSASRRRMNPSTASWAYASAAALTASCFQALGSRLSIALSTSSAAELGRRRR